MTMFPMVWMAPFSIMVDVTTTPDRKRGNITLKAFLAG